MYGYVLAQVYRLDALPRNALERHDSILLSMPPKDTKDRQSHKLVQKSDAIPLPLEMMHNATCNGSSCSCFQCALLRQRKGRFAKVGTNMSGVGALERLARARREKQQQHAASNSHVKNEEYMAEFEAAWSEMTGHGAEQLPTAQAKGISSQPADNNALPYKCTLPGVVNDGWLTGPVDEGGEIPPSAPNLSLRVSDASAVMHPATWGTCHVLRLISQCVSD